MNDFFTSWLAVCVFLFTGIILIRKNTKEPNGLDSIKFRGYIGGFGAIIYSMVLTIAKLLGKV